MGWNTSAVVARAFFKRTDELGATHSFATITPFENDIDVKNIEILLNHALLLIFQGFVAFCMSVSFDAKRAYTIQTCSGTMCDGWHSDKRCACVHTLQCPRRVLAFSVNICANREGKIVDLLTKIGLKMLDFSSCKLSDQLVDCSLQEVQFALLKINVGCNLLLIQ